MSKPNTDIFKRQISQLVIPESKEVKLKNARNLLEAQEGKIPEPVRKVIEHCTTKKIGFILSRNQYAGNCRDARSKRVRLGHKGIPLYDELKSIVGISKDNTGKTIILAMHCRGHMAIDLKQVEKICNFQSEISQLAEDELMSRFHIKFGSVNPFLLDYESKQSLLHVFDRGILKPLVRFPGTMMTNTGEHTWGIEFDPRDLVGLIAHKVIGKIAVTDTELKKYELPHRLNPKSIGIITGNGPDSGIALWQDINKNIVEILGDHFLGDISLPQVTVISVPAMGLSMELDRREQATWQALSEAVIEMKEQKVELLALACHTTHYFTDKIKEIFDGERQKFVSMPSVVLKYVEENDIDEMAILGISYVSNLDQWSAYKRLKRYKIEEIDYETKKKFHELGYFVKKKDRLHQGYKELNWLINNKIKSKNVIIALTELSILFQAFRKITQESERNIIDTLELYAQVIAEKSIGLTKE